jgi:hypothetical protein
MELPVWLLAIKRVSRVWGKIVNYQIKNYVMSVGYRGPISIGLINYEWVINVDT